MYKDNNVVLDLLLCRIPKHYKLAMHVFGLLVCCSTLKEMNEVVCSSAVLFCSPCSGANVQKHYNNYSKEGALNTRKTSLLKTTGHSK